MGLSKERIRAMIRESFWFSMVPKNEQHVSLPPFTVCGWCGTIMPDAPENLRADGAHKTPEGYVSRKDGRRYDWCESNLREPMSRPQLEVRAIETIKACKCTTYQWPECNWIGHFIDDAEYVPEDVKDNAPPELQQARRGL